MARNVVIRPSRGAAPPPRRLAPAERAGAARARAGSSRQLCRACAGRPPFDNPRLR